jgi:hypothetical protein
MSAEEVLGELQNGTKQQVVATCCLSNFGGVAIYYYDGECVVAQYYDNPPEIYEIEYIDDEDADDENADRIAIFRIGEIEIRLDECIITNFVHKID